MAFYSKWMLILSFFNVIAFTIQRNIQAEYENIHHHMSVGDLQAVFHVSRHSDVPEYEIIPLHSIHKREAPPHNTTDERNKRSIAEKLLKLEAFGKRHELALQPLDQQLFKGNLKMWSAESNSNGSISYTELPDTYVGDPYQDENNQAALLLHEDTKDGSLLMEGTIGHDLVIKPLPLHIRKYLTKKKVENLRNSDLEGSSSNGDEMFLDREVKLGQDQISENGFPLNSESKEGTAHPHHVVYRRQSSDNIDLRFSDFAYMEAGDMNANKIRTDRKRRKRSIVKREAPYIIYPEILVIVDYDGYRLHGGDNVQVKRYFVSFWNGVDLRYKLLKGPKVRISIAGLIISRGRDATPYLERNRVGRDAVDSAAALTDMGKYLFRERRLPVYDIAVAVTKLDMCRRHYQNDACNRGTAGFAYVGGACVVNKRLEKVNSVAIIEDTGGFSGIIVAAHEVGHLLGAVHDGSPPPTYLGGPGAEKCRWEDGFIMSDLRHSEKGFKWSPCSVSSFHHFLNGDTATCLYNSPHEDESLPRVLPGKLLSLDAQCRRDRGTSACFKDERVCSQLFCFDSGSGYCVAYRPAAEGSPCGDGQTCSNGICISEHENIIPDYSQNTPSYLRRQDQDIFGRAFYGNSTKRSEWEEFWRTATNPTVSSQNTQQYDPYNPYKNVFDFYTNHHQTTKNPYENLNKNWYNNKYHASSKPDTATSFATKKPTKNVFQDYNNLFYGQTTPQNDLYSYLKNDHVENDDCVDTSEEIPGAVSCYDYLTKYGLQYCADEYIRKNCCAAIKYLCNNQPL